MRFLTPVLSLRVAAALALVAAVGCGGSDAPATDTSESGDAAAPAQPSASGGSGDADLAEISDYELTMDDVRAWMEANLNLAEAARDPRVGAALDTDSDQASLDDTEALIESVPEARAAVEDAGLSARDYALVTYAMLQAGMAQFALEQGGDPEEVARELQVNPKNLAFMRDNKDAIAALQREYESRMEGN